MKPEKYRELTRDELERTARDLREELFNLRFRVSTQKIDNPLRMRHVRRDLARVLTILREDDIGKHRLPGSPEGKIWADQGVKAKKEVGDEGHGQED
ncbi:MAG TPA: 50S ribosomal protein L29 [bacterium]|nr:50S ribosomal protein L29 [bacterium]